MFPLGAEYQAPISQHHELRVSVPCEVPHEDPDSPCREEPEVAPVIRAFGSGDDADPIPVSQLMAKKNPTFSAMDSHGENVQTADRRRQPIEPKLDRSRASQGAEASGFSGHGNPNQLLIVKPQFHESLGCPVSVGTRMSRGAAAFLYRPAHKHEVAIVAGAENRGCFRHSWRGDPRFHHKDT